MRQMNINENKEKFICIQVIRVKFTRVIPLPYLLLGVMKIN